MLLSNKNIISNHTHIKPMKIKPLGARVVVKRIEEDEQVRGGIIIPDSAKEKSQEAEVIALGTGKEDDKPFFVKVGDKVLMPQYGGTQVKLDGVEYTIIEEDSLLGVIG
jgi:chaperonin GroES